MDMDNSPNRKAGGPNKVIPPELWAFSSTIPNAATLTCISPNELPRGAADEDPDMANEGGAMEYFALRKLLLLYCSCFYIT